MVGHDVVPATARHGQAGDPAVAESRRLRSREVCFSYVGAHVFQLRKRSSVMLGIAAAVLFFIAFLINAADVATNEVFASVNVMLLGLGLLALHVAGIGTGWSRRR